MKRQGNEQPYTKIVEELPEMRVFIVVLVKVARGNNCRAYVLVYNRSEGNTPLTIQALRNVPQAAET